jgi:hypothetical protein
VRAKHVGIVLLVFLAGFRVGMWAAELVSHWNGERLRIAAPELHYLTGHPLEDLKNGSPVTYAMELSLAAGARNLIRQRAFERFAFSYDIWEERFAVTRLRDSRSVANLSAPAAESWCLDQMDISTSGIARDTPVWIKLDIRVEDARGRRGLIPEPGMNLARLIDLFSQPRPPHQPGWLLDAGPLMLKDLRKPDGRGPG